MRKIMIALVSSSLALFATVAGILWFMTDSLHESVHEQMQAEAREYISRIHKQIDKDFQTLHTLASFVEASEIGDLRTLADGLAKANEQNAFISIAYFTTAGEGVVSTLNHDTQYDFPLADRYEAVRAAVGKALAGEDVVSHLFESEVTNDRIYIYSLPVYQDGQIVGALAASNHIEIFNDILQDNTVMNGSGHIHLLGSDGRFLLRSQNVIVQGEGINSIFDGPYIAADQQAEIRAKMQRQECVYSEFRYQGANYHFYLEPVGLNGWYLFCANSWWGTSQPLRHILLVVGISYVFILTLSVFLLYYGFFILRKSNAKLLNLAYFDQVTGAENALRFQQRLEKLREQTTAYSIATVDICNFKFINDLFGASNGDRMLCYMKQTIEAHLREGEFFCRDSADLFYLLLRDTEQARIRERLEGIVKRVGEATRTSQYHYEVSLHCGVAVRGDRIQALLALKSIKGAALVSVAFYNSAIHDQEREKNQIERNMKAALQKREFKLFLQPKIDLRTNALAGAEALVRWQKPDGTYRYPNEFIPLFEANGFCAQLDYYMVERVCEQLRAWMDAGIAPIPISVNQSRLLFLSGNYVELLERIVQRYRIPPELITLEILEGLAVDKLDEIRAKIRQLHAKGFKISMDDFGSGYSSLNTLYQLDIDELKLDRGFLQKATDEGDQRRQIILEQVIRFCRKLRIATVAEGVETQQHIDLLQELRCDYGQGYFYSKPISAPNFGATYMAQRRGGQA